MRWGVRDEMTNEHMTTELCMKELVSCQKLSIGIIMGKDRMEQILIVLVSSRAQLHLSWWTEVRLPACSSNCGFCRTQIAQRDPCGNGDRCEPVGQVCCNFISHQPFRILSNHPSLSRSTTRRNFVFLIGIFWSNLLQVVQDGHKPRAGPICVATN